MLAAGLQKELSRRLYIRTRTARTTALRLSYVAYAAALSGWKNRHRRSPQTVRALRERLEALFDEDFRDAEAGYYPRALIEHLPWTEYALALPKLLLDVPRTRERIRNGRIHELPEDAPSQYPRYYARNFHYQTDGYLGHTSAELYDLQVELLFGGTADVMRRRLIPPIVRLAREQARRERPPRLLDVACGTGHFLRMLGAALPQAQLFGLDLSPHYLARARETLPRDLNVSLVCENAERLPFVDGYFDAVANVYLLHELPKSVRARVLAEMARAVRPGGIVVVADSLQLKDAPELADEIRSFPQRFHEPYYLSYVRDDLAARLADAGLRVLESRLAFVTKLVVAERSAQ